MPKKKTCMWIFGGPAPLPYHLCGKPCVKRSDWCEEHKEKAEENQRNYSGED